MDEKGTQAGGGHRRIRSSVSPVIPALTVEFCYTWRIWTGCRGWGGDRGSASHPEPLKKEEDEVAGGRNGFLPPDKAADGALKFSSTTSLTTLLYAHFNVRYEIAEAVEGRRQDITKRVFGEERVAIGVFEIKINYWVVMRNLIRSLETGPAGRVASELN